MALQPNDLTTRERLQPGARGEIFQANLPGYRDGADRMNRTNMALNVSQHDVPNIKYMFDNRLPALFKFGFGFGYNQIVVPKGRIVAIDRDMDLVDFESQKQFNTLTLANGGVPVRLRKTTDVYGVGDKKKLVSKAMNAKPVDNIGKEWIPVNGDYSKLIEEGEVYRPFKDEKSAKDLLTDASLKVDEKTGKVVKTDGGMPDDGVVRNGNIPVGIIERNEYTRDDDAYNGMMPGPILTDALVELPYFAYKDKAESNPWGSAYGHLYPGCLVRSDENGRFVPSALSDPEKVKQMKMSEYELERQQVVGQVYSVNHELVPEGAAKWATWALEDRMNSEEFNPSVYAKTNRRGEDAVNGSPYNSSGAYPGYPYDRNFGNHDLHMLASTRIDQYDPRMNPEYRYSNLGIPGLTDGANAHVEEGIECLGGTLHYAGDDNDYVDVYLRTLDTNIEKGSLTIKIEDDGSDFVPCTLGAKVGDDKGYEVKYVSEENGIVVLGIDKDKAKAKLEAKKDTGVKVFFKYNKRGLAGVPTFMDWDGVVGSVKILLTK